jgi:hypothetical protein
MATLRGGGGIDAVPPSRSDRPRTHSAKAIAPPNASECANVATLVGSSAR